jgi:aminoglycoside phosphotransferase (APT) family kinase protein
MSSSHDTIDAAVLKDYLAQHIPNFTGPITLTKFAGGQSNPTYRLDTPSHSYVLRRKPSGVLLPTAHAIEREYRVMSALAATDVPVAKCWWLCEDASVIGSAFYVMDHVEGRIFWNPTLPDMANNERAEIYAEMNRVIQKLHSVDWQACGLADFGKPHNYFARQIDRWTKQYRASETTAIPAMERLMEWLPLNIPTDDATSIIHGDFRVDNMIFHPTEARVLAVLDWELSTLGHPLADFAYHCSAWLVPATSGRGIAGYEYEATGIPSFASYVEKYRKAMPLLRFDERDWQFAVAFSFFRIAAILQGVMARALQGNASSDEAIATGQRAAMYAELGWLQVSKTP